MNEDSLSEIVDDWIPHILLYALLSFQRYVVHALNSLELKVSCSTLEIHMILDTDTNIIGASKEPLSSKGKRFISSSFRISDYAAYSHLYSTYILLTYMK